MTYFDDYKTRLKSYGNNLSDARENNTINVIESTFKDSPNYKVVSISGVNVDSRYIKDSDDSSQATLLFKPHSPNYLGEIATINTSEYWLIIDFIQDEIFPKSMVRRCNEVLKWKDEGGTTHQYNCVVRNRSVGISSDDKLDLITNDGELEIVVQYNSTTKTIQPSQRFILGSRVYKIKGIDDITNVVDGKGTFIYTAEITSSSEYDDFSNQIADNSVLYGGSSSGDAGGGSGLW